MPVSPSPRVAWSLRQALRAVRVARTLRPAGAFLRDVARDSPVGRYRARRLDWLVTLRPRFDLQTAREALSGEAYELPPEAAAVLAARRPITILDLGANIGLYALAAIRTYDPARLIAVEPDPGNLELLHENVSRNGLTGRVQVHEAAAGARPGTVRFAAGHGWASRIAGTGDDEADIREVEMIDVFALAARADLVKMDIEGAEWDLLADPRLADSRVAAVVLEWHGERAPEPDPQRLAERLLRDAGFEVRARAHPRATTGELWAWRDRDA